MNYTFTLDDNGVNALARALQTSMTFLDQRINEMQPMLQHKKEVAELQVELQLQLSNQQGATVVTPRAADPVVPQPAEQPVDTESKE